MKISSDVGSPDYIGAANGGRYAVELNGKRLSNVVEADDVAGVVVINLIDKETGLPLIDRVKGIVCRETLYGKVSIIDLRPGAHPAPAGIGRIRG